MCPAAGMCPACATSSCCPDVDHQVIITCDDHLMINMTMMVMLLTDCCVIIAIMCPAGRPSCCADVDYQGCAYDCVFTLLCGRHHVPTRRQTIMTSSFANPQLNATFNRHTSSHAGKFRLVATPTGVLGQVVPQVRGHKQNV
jgi:hypothetical protein